MGDKSAIEWTEATWNPVTGCSKVSPGCANCYAETLSLRFGWSKKPWTPENAKANVLLRHERLDQPLRWQRPRMIFVNSMSDLFHELVPRSYIDKVFAVMALAERHTFQVLTKRPERALEYMTEGKPWQRVSSKAFEHNRYSGAAAGLFKQEAWPLPNVWLGTSIENSRHTFRADYLRETPAAVRFISAEPLLGSLFESGGNKRPLDLTGIDWLIVGGESGGRESRPMHPTWVKELRAACLGRNPAHTFGDKKGEGEQTAFFFKQWGSWGYVGDDDPELLLGYDGRAVPASEGGDLSDLGNPYRLLYGMRYIGRTSKAAGKELDGREWCEMPEAA